MRRFSIHIYLLFILWAVESLNEAYNTNSSPKTASLTSTIFSRSIKNLMIGSAVILPTMLQSRATLPSLSANDLDSDIWTGLGQERIFDTKRKSYLPSHPEKFISKELKSKRVVIMGEVHSNSLDHLLEFRLLSTLAGFYNPNKLAIGLECFYRQHQQALDNFIFDHGSMGKLKEETNWKETWGYDLSNYAKIFNYAYKNKIQLVGLNVPLQVVQYVAYNGLDKIPSSLQSLLPEVDLSNSEHKARFFSAISNADGHSMSNHGDETAMQHIYESQSLWDEYMAESASNFVLKNPSMLLLVIAGTGHVSGRVGMPDRIKKRIKQDPFVVVPYEVKWNKEGLPDIDVPPSARECDWAWFHAERDNDDQA
jgi:uncharacterized iron-regulated protein